MAVETLVMSGPLRRCRVRVLYGDTDAGGVVYYATYLRFFEAGRTEFMRELALPYSKVEEEGVIMPVTDCRIHYRAPARYDDLLEIETCLAVLKRASCTFHYRILRPGGGEEKEELLAFGATSHAAVNRQGRPVRLPESLLTPLTALGSDQK